MQGTTSLVISMATTPITTPSNAPYMRNFMRLTEARKPSVHDELQLVPSLLSLSACGAQSWQPGSVPGAQVASPDGAPGRALASHIHSDRSEQARPVQSVNAVESTLSLSRRLLKYWERCALCVVD